MDEPKTMHVRSSGPYLLFMLATSIFALLVLGSEVALDLAPDSRQILDYADNVLCGLFFVDFLISLWQAEDRLAYFIRWGWLDLLSCVPSVDALRTARLARILRIFRVLRAVRAAKILAEFILRHRAKNALMAVSFIALLLVVFSSIGMLHFETVPEANIKTPSDAVWWATETITTVGYGDRFPVTPEGRILAAVLMICGVGLIGVFTGFVAYWFMRPSEMKKDDLINSLHAEIERLRNMELQALRQEVHDLRAERDRLKGQAID
jgi:voltage-gated potassium channel